MPLMNHHIQHYVPPVLEKPRASHMVSKAQLLSYILCAPYVPDGQISRVLFIKREEKTCLKIILLSGQQPKPLALYEHLLCALTKWGLLFTKVLPAPPTREAAHLWGHPWTSTRAPRVVSGGQPRPSSEFLNSLISSPLQVASGDLGSEALASCFRPLELSSVSSAPSCHHKFSSS